MTIKILEEGKLIRFTCPICKTDLARQTDPKAKELEIICIVCGSKLLWTPD